MGWLDDGKARMHDDGMTFAEAEIILSVERMLKVFQVLKANLCFSNSSKMLMDVCRILQK